MNMGESLSAWNGEVESSSGRQCDRGSTRQTAETRVGTMGQVNSWGQPSLRRQRPSNMQLAAKMPIGVTVIGVCALRKNFDAAKPNRKARRRLPGV